MYDLGDCPLRFEWNSDKALANRRKHGVSFEEALTVFADSAAKLIADPDHSVAEDRFILLGLSQGMRLLVVVHVYRQRSQAVRIISARKATASEQAQYG